LVLEFLEGSVHASIISVMVNNVGRIIVGALFLLHLSIFREEPNFLQNVGL
jgi:hypothetical protein